MHLHKETVLQIAAPSQAHLSKQNDAAVNRIAGYFILFLPLLLLLTITGDRKFQSQILRNQIQKLEVLWKLSFSETKF
jgi:hypothetical protein